MKQIVIDIDGVVGEGNNTVVAIKEKVAPYSGIGYRWKFEGR